MRNCAGSTISLGVFSAKVGVLHYSFHFSIFCCLRFVFCNCRSTYAHRHSGHVSTSSFNSSQRSLLPLSSLKGAILGSIRYLPHRADSSQGQKIREIYLPIPVENPTLGISLQWTSLSVTEDVWHILDVIPNSPADVAGLLPYGDYVIGSPEGLVRSEAGLGELVEDVRLSLHLKHPLRTCELMNSVVPQQASPPLCLQPRIQCHPSRDHHPISWLGWRRSTRLRPRLRRSASHSRLARRTATSPRRNPLLHGQCLLR